MSNTVAVKRVVWDALFSEGILQINFYFSHVFETGALVCGGQVEEIEAQREFLRYGKKIKFFAFVNT